MINKYYIFINILQNYIVIVIHGLPDGRTNISTNDPVVYYRQSVFIPFLDNMIKGLEERFSAVALASELVPSVMLKNPEALSSDQLRMIADAFPDLPSTHGLQSEYER